MSVLLGANQPSYNAQVEALASAARTAAPDDVQIDNMSCAGAHIIIVVTAKTSSPSIVVTVSGKDVSSGNLYTVLTSAAITATGTTVLKIFPGAVGDPDLVANDFLPKTTIISVAHGNSNSITYQIGIIGLR